MEEAKDVKYSELVNWVEGFRSDWSSIGASNWPITQLMFAVIEKESQIIRLSAMPCDIFRYSKDFETQAIAKNIKNIADNSAPEFSGILGHLSGQLWPDKNHRVLPPGQTELRENGMLIDQICQQRQGMRTAIAGLMSGLILMAWTTFESAATELWIESVNSYPSVLARQNGKQDRITSKTDSWASLKDFSEDEPITFSQKQDERKDSDDDEEDEVKDVSLNAIRRITGETYNLEKNMGELLKRKFKFISLRGIRRAYAVTFSERTRNSRTVCEKLDAALADSRLDCLSIVRNLIVHHGGIANESYVNDCRRVPLAPQLNVGEKLHVDGVLCRALIDNGLSGCKNIITSTYKWLKIAGGNNVNVGKATTRRFTIP